MIDTFALALTHALLLLVAVIVLRRPELDDERADDTRDRYRRRR